MRSKNSDFVDPQGERESTQLAALTLCRLDSGRHFFAMSRSECVVGDPELTPIFLFRGYFPIGGDSITTL
jgi:hypothetical protein